MDHHRFFISWDGHSVQETKRILSEGIARLPTDLKDAIVFKVQAEKPPVGSFSLDTAIVIAIIGSSGALAASVLSCLAQIASAKISKGPSTMEVHLEDGSLIKIPINASDSEINRLIGASRCLKAIEQVKLRVQGKQ